MQRIVSALVLLAGLVLNNTAHAAIGRCLLEVDGIKYLSGPCNIELEPGGDFTIGTGNELTASAFFAYVSVERPGVAQGNWNGSSGGSRAHDSLGTLIRNYAEPACWENERARVCAWAHRYQ